MAQSLTSQQIGTDCKECIFYEDPKKCKLGKLSKFKKAGASFEERDGQYLVNRVCSFRRTEKWQEEKSIEECIESVQKEVTITGSIVVYASNMQDLDKCLSKLSNSKHSENFKIIIAHHSKLVVRDVFDYIQNQDHFEEMYAVGVNEAEVHTGEIHFLDEAFKRSRNGFIICIDSSKDFDENMLDKLNHYIYNEMQKLLYVPATEEFNVTVVMAVIYKFLKGNKFWNFEEKINAVTKHQNIESQITSWDKINEKYSN
jgi:hypothetical protein